MKKEETFMVDIIIGNNRNNVVARLKKSSMARLLLVLCWWYLYQVIGKEAGLHVDVLLIIAVCGVLLLNLVYMPMRLLADQKIGHGVKLLFLVIASVITRYYFTTTSMFSMAHIFRNIIVGIIISFSATEITVALKRKLDIHSQKKVFQNREFSHMDGWEFEQWCGQWLREHGYVNVQVTSGSGDYGADVLCEKNGVSYAVQCKCYTGKVPYRAVEEIVTAKQYYGTDKAMVMTNSVLTAQAQEAAAKLNVLVIDGSMLG
jgi:restriction system protein